MRSDRVFDDGRRFETRLESVAAIDQRTSPTEIQAKPYVWRDPTTIPRREMLYGGHLFKRYLSATFAGGGVGKTSLVVVDAVAMASGRNLLGEPVAEPLRVWYYNLEDPEDEIERKVAAVLIYFRIDPEEIAGRLFLNSGRDTSLVIARKHRGDTIIAEPVVEGLTQAFLRDRIDVGIFDPMVRTHQVDENSTEIDLVCGEFKRVADRANAAIELIHHVRKSNGGGDAKVEDGRGSGAIKDACRSVRVLNAMSKDDAGKAGVDRPGFYFRADIGKANLLPPAENSTWYRLNSVPLGNGDDISPEGDKIGVVTRWTWPDALDGVTAEKVREVQDAIDGGRWRENYQAMQWVGKPVAEVLDIDIAVKAGRARVTSLINIWLRSGALVKVEGEDEKRNKRMFVEVGERA